MVNIGCYLLWWLGSLIVFPDYCFLGGGPSPSKGVWKKGSQPIGKSSDLTMAFLSNTPPVCKVGWCSALSSHQAQTCSSCAMAFQGSWNPGSCLFSVSSFGEIALSQIALWWRLPLLHLISPASWRRSKPFSFFLLHHMFFLWVCSILCSNSGTVR